MDDRSALNRVHSSLKAFYTLMGHAAPASTVFEFDGGVASIVPDTPETSLFNSVVVDRYDQLERAYPEIARRYLSVGVRAWTVWLMPDAADAEKFLGQHGHKLRNEPAAMAIELAKMQRPALAGLDFDLTKNLGTVAHINEEAYGMTGASFRAAMRKMDDPSVRFYLARVGGEPMSTVMTLEQDGDCGLYCIATYPTARKSGLSTQLISAALLDAQTRGCTTATVQAMPMVQSIMRTLGFRDLGSMAMWELRR